MLQQFMRMLAGKNSEITCSSFLPSFVLKQDKTPRQKQKKCRMIGIAPWQGKSPQKYWSAHNKTKKTKYSTPLKSCSS